MKRNVIMAAVAALLLTGCQQMSVNDMVEKPEGVPSKVFTFAVKGDFTTCFEEMTRAAVRLENDNTAGITDIWVLDYSPSPTSPEGEGVLVQSVHQHVGDADFGAPKMALAYGHHDIKLIAAKGDTPTLTASALSWTKVKDTFVLDYPVDVVASSNGNRAPELKRAISGLSVVVTDAIPIGAKTLVLTLGSRSQSLTLPGLSALPYSESSVELDISSYVGKSGKTFGIYTLAGDEEWTSTASIAVKKADGSIITSLELPDVSLKKNRMTTLTGEVFNRSNGFSVAIDDAWDTPLNSTF